MTIAAGTNAAGAAAAKQKANATATSVEAPFYIPATAAMSRPRRSIKHDDTFAVLDSHGDIGATSGAPDGMFHKDTRHLSHLELLINGTQPLLLGSGVRDDNLCFNVDLTNPDLYADGAMVLMKDTVHVQRTIYLADGSLRERIAVTNHGADHVRFSLSMVFAADFADLFEVRGIKRKRRGQIWSEIAKPGHISLYYRGLDGVQRETALTFEPLPARLADGLARFDLALRSGEQCAVFVVASSEGRLPSTQSFFKGLARLHRTRKAASRHAATVETSNTVLNDILCRSAADLYMLTTDTQDGPVPYAGIPWYSTTFGRDSLITALQMLWVDPAVARGVLKRLSRLQATTVSPENDAEPGKILHEMRGGEMAALREVPFALYYGSIDATPLYVMLAGAYLERTGDIASIRSLWPTIEKCLAWVDRAIAGDPRGFLSYERAHETGLANQGWKDSHDSIFHADGRLARGPIALVEVQGYVYAAKTAAAMCADRLGEASLAARLMKEAEEIRARFEAAFWCEDIGTYAIALDGEGARCAIRTSNAGHVLATGIAEPDRANRIITDMLRPDMFSGWGIRTVARGEARYNPMSYHNGSIWPHDNAMIGHGMARYGRKAAMAAVFDAMMRATAYMDHRRIPELYCGFRRRQGRGPTLYPVACAPQAWAAAAPFHMLQGLLGLEFDPAAHEIRLVQPVVPELAGEVTIRNLHLGDATIDFRVQRRNDAVALEVLRVRGEVRLSMILERVAS
ncbi:MAG: amylo-alpha-1,6-glucosidase [Hyphomicrobiales bacterium]|nr:MAG: amylo-alpha-1,6-glucosidase [Hyphomicrobiales bacterium]